MVMKQVFKIHNEIKRNIINEFAGEKLLDLASGRGGDLHKWITNKKIKKVLGYDINQESVSEAKKRLLGFGNNKKQISFYVKDLSRMILNCFKNSQGPFDLITCNFAFHYFFKSKNTLDTILKSINNCSKKGTYFACTLFDGDKILETNGSITTSEYVIKRLDPDIEYSKNKIYNKRISVYIKNSILDTPETEYIVRPSHLIRKLKSINFDLVKSQTMSEALSKSGKNFVLTENEKQFLELNRLYVFTKTR
jgi:mRNA (guanine-N7-)-methyltransferase